MFKQVFDLVTGECLDDPAVSVRVFPVEVRAGVVHVLAAGEAFAEPRGGSRAESWAGSG
jgi:nitrite reductase (NADH) small subunit